MAEDVLPGRTHVINSEPMASTSQGAHYETQDGIQVLSHEDDRDPQNSTQCYQPVARESSISPIQPISKKEDNTCE